MGYIQSVYDQVGLAFSIVGLVLVVPTVFIFKQYNRFLDHTQMIFYFSLMLAPNLTTIFARYLDQSWSRFIPNFLKFCKDGELVCQSGYALSFTICILGVDFLMWAIVMFEKCCKKSLVFEPVYSFFKGFFKWTYVPLVYHSTVHLITALKSQQKISNTQFIPSVVVVAWVVLFPIFQLIFYKCIQQPKDQIWIKWFEFLGYNRQLSIVVILILGHMIETNTTIAKYFVYGPIVLYDLLYLWKGVFLYKVMERVFFGIEEAIIITLFSLFLFSPQHIRTYQLDFIGLAIILLLNLTYITARMISWLCYGQLQPSKVNPQEQPLPEQKINQSSELINFQNNNDFSPKNKRKNKYDEPDDLLASMGSKEELNSSIRKGNDRRRR